MALTTEQILDQLRALPPVERLRVIEQAVHEVAAEVAPQQAVVILPRFHGHKKSHASAVGVFSHETEAKEVQRAV
jgi:hypothetical protein